jgi:transcriptional regulatory protein LevR
MLDVRPFRASDFDIDHYMVVAKVWERLKKNKKAAQKSDIEKFNLRKQNELEVRKQYQIEISNSFAAL